MFSSQSEATEVGVTFGDEVEDAGIVACILGSIVAISHHQFRDGKWEKGDV